MKIYFPIFDNENVLLFNYENIENTEIFLSKNDVFNYLLNNKKILSSWKLLNKAKIAEIDLTDVEIMWILNKKKNLSFEVKNSYKFQNVESEIINQINPL